MWHRTRKTTKRDRQVSHSDVGNVHTYSSVTRTTIHAVTNSVISMGQQLAVSAGIMSEFDTDSYRKREEAL